MNKGNKVSDTTIHTRIIHIKSMFNWAVKMELLEKNPIQNMPMPTPKMRRDFIPPERFEEFLGYIENEEFRDFCFVMLDSGARVQEMLVLEAQYYDKEKKRLTLPAEKSKGRKACRTIYLPPKSSNIVETYCGHFPVGSLFRDSNAVPWRKDSLGRMLKPLKEKMGMPGLCMTTLRHSFAHSRLVKGQDAVTVAKLMGHASTNMVYQRYGHLDGSDFLAEKANELAL
jgi:integrase